MAKVFAFEMCLGYFECSATFCKRCEAFCILCVQFLDLCVKFWKKRHIFENVCKQLKKTVNKNMHPPPPKKNTEYNTCGLHISEWALLPSMFTHTRNLFSWQKLKFDNIWCAFLSAITLLTTHDWLHMLRANNRC